MSCYFCKQMHDRDVSHIAQCSYSGCGRNYCAASEYHGQHCVCGCGASICRTHLTAHMRDEHSDGDASHCFPHVAAAAGLNSLVQAEKQGLGADVQASTDELLGTPKPPDSPFSVTASGYVGTVLPSVMSQRKGFTYSPPLNVGVTVGWPSAAFTPVVMMGLVPMLLDTTRRAVKRLDELGAMDEFESAISEPASAMLARLSKVRDKEEIGVAPLSEAAQVQYQQLGGRLGREMTALSTAARDHQATADKPGALDWFKAGEFVGPWFDQSDEASMRQNASLGASLATDTAPPMRGAEE